MQHPRVDGCGNVEGAGVLTGSDSGRPSYEVAVSATLARVHVGKYSVGYPS